MPEQLQQEVWRKSRLLSRVERMARIGAWELDVASGLLSMSDEACRIYEVDPETVLNAEAVATFFPLRDLETCVDLCKSVIESGEGVETQGEILSARGARKWAHRIIEPELSEGKVVRLIGIVRDLSEGREHEEALWRVAHYDALTKVPNRHYWTVRLDQAVARAAQTMSNLTILMFDLDGFKEINDTRGHAAGDAVLVLLGERLGETLPPKTFHARLGGDEFAVLLDATFSTNEVEGLVRDILAAIQKPMNVGALRLRISGTFGSAQFPTDAKTADDLMRKADIALYQAKRSHRSSFVSFRADIGDLFNEKRAAIDLLASAIDRQRLMPFYQPKIDLKTGKRVGFEALCRIVEEDGAIFGPPHFLPALQDAASCARLGAAMLELVTHDLADWLGCDFKPGRVALNVTSADFEKAPLHERIIARLLELGLPASCLEIEVTENTILGKEAGMISDALRAMRAAGITIALDDFGTGYASLTHLRDAPITCLKLDRSFVGGLARGAESAIIIRSIIDLGHSLGMRVVAEGVETNGQAEFLRSVGCDHAQGFLFGRPMPRDTVRAQLKNEALRESQKRPLDFTKTGSHDLFVRRVLG